MKRVPCQYAIVRFQPFIETGEFANVGIIMMASKLGLFNFDLVHARYGRITQFFKELDSRVFRAAMQNLRDELERIGDVLKTKSEDIEFAKNMFREIVRPRETIIRFSNSRVVLAEDPMATLKDLFSFYIERNFVTEEYQEDLVKDMRRLLNEANIGDRFKEKTITSGLYQATFPFVELRNERAFKVIKPLSFNQEKTKGIIEQGLKWGARIRELKRQDISSQKVLFAVNGPDDGSERGKAYKIAVERLKEAEVEVVPYRDKEEILRFARSN